MKSIVILLLLLLFFVSGMLFGVERERTEFTQPEAETLVVNDPARQQMTDLPTIQNEEFKQAPDHLTQKMASFIGDIVKGFYEVVVQLLYQVVQLFY